MPRRDSELLGHIQCPKCTNPAAEVRRDARGHPFTKCQDAAHTPALVIPTHGGDRGELLLLRMRPLRRSRRPEPRSELARALVALHA